MPEKAWIQFLALKLIHEESMHGYRLIQELEDRSYVDPRRLKSGSLYVILNRMEHHGLLTSLKLDPSDTRSPRVYSITEYGVRELVEGLRYIKEKQRINNELIQYFEENFKESTS
jgi:DNA-binding PadR family transcriptional regulator